MTLPLCSPSLSIQSRTIVEERCINGMSKITFNRVRQVVLPITILTTAIGLFCCCDSYQFVHAIRIKPNTMSSYWSNSRRSQFVNWTASSFIEEEVRRLTSYQKLQNQQPEHNGQFSNSSSIARRVSIPTNPDDHLVHDLPLLDPSQFETRHWAGHLPANDNAVGDKFFFYWLFEPDFSESSNHINDPLDPSIPLIIWLNGGPACSRYEKILLFFFFSVTKVAALTQLFRCYSTTPIPLKISMDGLFIENGPFRIVFDTKTKHYKVIPDKYSWHKLPAYTLYIDQPVGTGLSITSSHRYPTNDDEVNADIYYFFQQFLKLHSDKFVDSSNKLPAMNRRLYFSGESYAGHYIPSFINYLTKKNNQISLQEKQNNIIVTVTGAAIGNGWTDPYYQYGAAEFAFVHGLIDREQMNLLLDQEKQCQKMLNQGIYNVDICFDLIGNIEDAANGKDSGYTLLGYDIRQTRVAHIPRLFPPGHKVLESYLGGWPINNPHDPGSMSPDLYKDVLKALHAEAMLSSGRQYTECTDPPYNALAGNDGKGVVDDVIDILNTGTISLLFFNGMYDLVCNHVGNELFLDKMNWNGTMKWRNADRYAWYAPSAPEDQVSGYMKEYKNLMYLKIKDAGHMVPLDRPEVAFDMMKTFITPQLTFRTSLQEIKKSIDETADAGKTCEVCPTCYTRDSGRAGNEGTPEANSHNEDASSNPSTSIGTFVISYAWVVAGIAVAFLLVFVVVARSQQRRHRGGGDHIPLPSSANTIDSQYDIELRNKPSYHDDDDSTDYNNNHDDKVQFNEDESYSHDTGRNRRKERTMII